MTLPGWLEIVIRSLGAFIILLIATKLFVKKSLAHFSFFEAAAMLIIAVILASGSFQLATPIGYSLTAVIAWIAMIGSINYIALKSISFRNFIFGGGVPVIKDGKILEDNLKKQRYTTDDLLTQLRSKSVFKTADVEFAVLEPSGDINVLLKKENQPLTAKDLNMPYAKIKEPQAIIMDGKVMDEPLATIGLNRAWLESELEKQGIAIENVFLGQVDHEGQLTVDLFDDKLKVAEPTEKPLLLASIKKCQADLEIFTLQTENKVAKQLFSECATELKEILNDVKIYLK